MTTRAESHGWAECVLPSGRTSECAHIAGQIVRTKNNVARVARLANKSATHFAKYASELADAKAQYALAVSHRDRHMAECPGAVDRFDTT